jgi:hypothetical protein
MRTVLAGEAEGVCSGAGGVVTDSSGEIRGKGDSPGIPGEVGVGDSGAATTEAKVATRNAKLIFLVMSSEVETSRTLPKKVSRDSSQPSHKATAGQATSRGMTSGLDVVSPIHVWKKVVTRFAVAQKFFIDLIGNKLIV